MSYYLLRGLTWIALRILYSMLGGIRVEGQRNIPKRGGVLVAPNHISDADPLTVGWAMARPSYFMAKEELFEMGWIGRYIRWMRGFPVKRNTADRAALRKAEELLERGEAVVIFPEGKISETAQLMDLFPGTLMIAQRANVPIVPAILIGTDKLMPYGTAKLQHAAGSITVRFGAPVSVQDLTGGGKGGEAYKRGAVRLKELMLALQAGLPYPDPTPTPANARAEPNSDISETHALRPG